MNERAAAEEHLRVIRSLMERATIYRAISAPTALVGGITALLVTGYLFWRSRAGTGLSTTAMSREFTASWLVAPAIGVAANTLFLWRGAVRGQRPFFSPGLRLALRSISPSILLAAVFTFAVARAPNVVVPTVLTVSWILLYGLALLATSAFSPRSLSILGWCFVLSGCLCLLLLSTRSVGGETLWDSHDQATLAMGLTFGIFHLVYAACTWTRGRDPEPTQLASE